MIEPETLAFVGTADLSGLLRGVGLPWAALEAAMAAGIALPGHVPLLPPAGGAAGGADLLLLPDPSTRAFVPAPGAPDLVLLLGDLLEPDGAPWACCPRYFLRRALAALHAEFGLTVRAGFTHGFDLPGGTEPPWTLGALRRHAPFCGTLAAVMRANGVEPGTIQPLGAPGEFAVAAADAVGVAAADRAVVTRELIAAVAAVAGVGRPTLGTVRIGASLRDDFNRPAMADPGGQDGLTDEAEHWVAGVLHHLPALVAIVAPRGVGAPRWAELGRDGRPGTLRLLAEGAESGPALPTRLELDLGDAAASPFLALGALVWAGLDGLREGRRLAEQVRRPLPATPAEALDVTGESVVAAEWFGMEFRERFLRFGRAAVGPGGR